jgi:hypothetical protein
MAIVAMPPSSRWLGRPWRHIVRRRAARFASLLALIVVAQSSWSLAQPSKASATPDTEQDAAERRLVIGDFQGKGAKAARAAVIDALEAAGFEIVAKAEVFAGTEPTAPEAYVALAAKHRLSAFITGKLEKGKKGYKLELSVRNGSDGIVLDQAEFEAATMPKLRAQLSVDLAQRFADTLYQTAPPAQPTKPEPKPAAPEEPETSPAAVAAPPPESDRADDDTDEDERRYSMFEVDLGIRGYSRDLTYNDDLFNRLAVFHLGAAPAPFIALRAYPMVSSSDGFLRHIGVVGGFEQGIATTVLDRRRRELEVTTRQFYAGLRARLPLGLHELGLTVAYGQHRAHVDEPEGQQLVPDVDYEFLRANLDARLRAASVIVGVHGGYRLLVSMGPFESETWFPRASGGAVEVGVFLGQALSKSLVLYGGFDLQRYFFSVNPEPGDRNIAGGAVDQYLSLWAALAWRWPSE